MSDDWGRRAECKKHDPEIWFPISETGAIGRAQVAEAKRICRTCPVLRECRAYILALEGGKNADRRHGIAAALTRGERYGIARRRAARRTAAREATTTAA